MKKTNIDYIIYIQSGDVYIMDKIIISEMIKKLRESYHLSQDELGEKMNVSGKTIHSWEKGRTEPNMGKVQMLADFFGVSTDTMIYGYKNDNANRMDIIFNDYFPLKYASNLSAGSLDEILESDPDSVVYVPIRFQSIKNHIYAFKVNGTSMNNIIADGSIVIADTDIDKNQIKDGTIVVALVDGLATIKRLYQNSNQITLMPDSTDKSHKPIMIDPTITTVTILGKVIWHMNPDDIFKLY